MYTENKTIPVSYTHLDVYTRQGWNWWGRLPIFPYFQMEANWF